MKNSFNIDAILTTRGDNGYGYCLRSGRMTTCDKCFGLVINGRKYWLGVSSCCLFHLRGTFKRLGVKVFSDWSSKKKRVALASIIDAAGGFSYANIIPIKKIAGRHDNIFSERYGGAALKNAAFNGKNLWWGVDELREEINRQRLCPPRHNKAAPPRLN